MAGTLADCEAYVDKLAKMGLIIRPTNSLLVPAMRGYGNTNYYFEDAGAGVVNTDLHELSLCLPGTTRRNVKRRALGKRGLSIIHKYHSYNSRHKCGRLLTWGANGGKVDDYYTNVFFSGSSGWYLIETIESFNGTVVALAHKVISRSGSPPMLLAG